MLLWKFTPEQPPQHNFITHCLLTEEETVLGGAVISKNEKELSEERGGLSIHVTEGQKTEKVMSSLQHSPRNVLRVAGILFSNQCYQMCTATIPRLSSQGSKVETKCLWQRLSNVYLPVAHAPLNKTFFVPAVVLQHTSLLKLPVGGSGMFCLYHFPGMVRWKGTKQELDMHPTNWGYCLVHISFVSSQEV